jgi:hypothetical protein
MGSVTAATGGGPEAPAVGQTRKCPRLLRTVRCIVTSGRRQALPAGPFGAMNRRPDSGIARWATRMELQAATSLRLETRGLEALAFLLVVISLSAERVRLTT